MGNLPSPSNTVPPAGTSVPGADLQELCAVLTQQTGNDFSRYKPATLHRRVQRRLQVTGNPTVQAYQAYLEGSPEEGAALLKDLLISVTAFFRDPEVFDGLMAHVLPDLLAGEDGPVRVWVPGCATGEEAYSLAILLREALGATRKIQIFATDIDTAALIHAKAGRYGDEAMRNVTPERRRRCFTQDGGHWLVNKELRELCLFSCHNLLRDPPFSSLHLISCRNLFIYLQPSVQRRVVPLFHFALKARGVLLLGSSEGLGAKPEAFEPLDKTSRIFRRREVFPRPALEFPAGEARPRHGGRGRDGAGVQPATGLFERMLLEEYVPASAIVNEAGDVLFCAGHLGRFLHPALGAPSTNLLLSTGGALRRELRRLLANAAGGALSCATVAHDAGHGEESLTLTVRPMPGMVVDSGLYAVIIQKAAAPAGEPATPSDRDLPLLDQMDMELRTAKAELQTTVEELEVANEELRIANEEMQSSNEELQISQEELQSVNEELSTINAELHQKVRELYDTNSDLQNLLVSTEIATLFLDLDLRITRFTPAATELYGLLDGDLGRSILNLVPQFEGLDLPALAREVLASHQVREAHARSLDGRSWFIARLRPYRTLSQGVRGVVVTFVDYSAIRDAQSKALASEARFRDLFEHMVNGFAHCRMAFDGDDPVDFLYLSVNRTFRTQTGLENAAGQWVSELIPGIREADPDLFAAYGRVARTGVPERLDIYVEALDDWYDISVYGAGPDEFIAVFEVVTARKKAEAALRESELRYRSLFENSRAVKLLIDPEGGAIRDANGAAEAFYGWSREQLTALRIQDINTLGGARVLDELRKVPTGAQQSFQFQHRVADGSLRDVEVYSCVVPVDHKARIYSIIHDVSDRKRAEEALRISEQRMNLAMEKSHTGGWEFDLIDHSAYRTPEHARIFGDDPADSGWSLERFLGHVLPEDRDAVARTIQEAMAALRDWSLECRIQRAEGEVRWVGLSGGPLNAHTGEPVRMAGIVQDLTERKRVESEVHALEHQINHLQRLDSIGRLAGGVSHDINNVLAAIMAVGTLLKVQHPDDPDLTQDADTLLHAAARGRDLVKRLRDFSRKELESAAPFDLNDLARGEAELLDRTTFKKVDVRLELEAELPLVYGEASAVANALMNLCLNASDAMPGGGVLCLATRSLGQGFVELVVQDEGCGMAQEVLSRAMEPFFTTKPLGKGTGLGLSQVYGTMKAHGGTLELQSQPGQGTRVSLVFPPALHVATPALEPAPVVTPRHLSILLVDDEEIIRRTVVVLFQALGHQVCTATGGQDALEQLRAGLEPELVVLDLNMPGMDGSETLDHLRQLRPDLPVIFATGYVDERIPMILSRYPRVRILKKPFTLAEIEQVLTGWF